MSEYKHLSLHIRFYFPLFKQIDAKIDAVTLCIVVLTFTLRTGGLVLSAQQGVNITRVQA